MHFYVDITQNKRRLYPKITPCRYGCRRPARTGQAVLSCISLLHDPYMPFYFTTSICTVLLLIPNLRAASLTVARFSMIYAASSQARSSMFPFKTQHSLSRYGPCICGKGRIHAVFCFFVQTDVARSGASFLPLHTYV